MGLLIASGGYLTPQSLVRVDYAQHNYSPSLFPLPRNVMPIVPIYFGLFLLLITDATKITHPKAILTPDTNANSQPLSGTIPPPDPGPRILPDTAIEKPPNMKSKPRASDFQSVILLFPFI